MSENHRKLVMKLGRLHLLERMHRHRTLSDYPIYPGQHPILVYIAEHEPCSQRELADGLCISPPSVATSLKRMERTGLVTRESDASDQRYNRISLTPKGWEIMKEVKGHFDETDRLMFQGFSEKQLQDFEKMLSLCIQNLTDKDAAERSTLSLLQETKMMQKRLSKEDSRYGEKNPAQF